ncbi:Fe(3+) ions import ATP-binding protein FbpC [Aureimonas sp. SA4125]|uniref:ABC transporter ATP-binding protein n=1 Tax=Aureimonas sp. SA4125 TaxID=2826993 RepID=UPI001CC3D580|nr:ABC transporter ATP-binding protein [Aureimonas sp. SA4125]BDA86191.1 Fe(3+) ions import ATP-binding protein FbpC [Aureimonas sp. SA4125]
MSFLRLESVSKRFGTVTALDAVDLDIPAGTRTAIVGPSGSGKSTLLNLVAGFEAPDSGRILLDGVCLADGERVVPAYQRAIGVVSQDGALFPHLDVEHNIGFGLPRRAADRKAVIDGLMELVELDRSMLGRRPHQLSGGQQQRVALARALARRPRLMLLDEPFSALDAGLRESMRTAVVAVLQKAGVASLLVTHDQAEALSFADQVAVLRDGRLVQYGQPRALYFAPTDAVTASFLGDAIIMPATLVDGWATCPMGRVRVDSGSRRGTAEIMLRPEQIRLSPLAEAGASADRAKPCHARIESVAFGGSLCTVSLVLVDPHGPVAHGAQAFRVKVLSLQAPLPGAEVALHLDGVAHLFGTGPASAA